MIGYDGFTWWEINYEDDPDGWSAENWIRYSTTIQPGNQSSPCHTITSPQSVPSPYGSPYDTRNGRLLIRADCSDNQATVTVGDNQADTYVWGTGYQWTGSIWEQRQLTCNGQQESEWCIGSAQTNIPTGFSNPDWIVGYTCQWDGSKWRCGCRDSTCAESQRFWQLQGIRE